jgi:hypothetical protein
MSPHGQADFGDRDIQKTQTLADGTHLENSGNGQFYRDDKGRMRSENGQAATIFDQVAGSIYYLPDEAKAANQWEIPADVAWC